MRIPLLQTFEGWDTMFGEDKRGIGCPPSPYKVYFMISKGSEERTNRKRADQNKAQIFKRFSASYAKLAPKQILQTTKIYSL